MRACWRRQLPFPQSNSYSWFERHVMMSRTMAPRVDQEHGGRRAKVAATESKNWTTEPKPGTAPRAEEVASRSGSLGESVTNEAKRADERSRHNIFSSLMLERESGLARDLTRCQTKPRGARTGNASRTEGGGRGRSKAERDSRSAAIQFDDGRRTPIWAAEAGADPGHVRKMLTNEANRSEERSRYNSLISLMLEGKLGRVWDLTR